MGSNKPNSAGVIENFDFSKIDDLLNLEGLHVRMVIFKTRSEAEVSSAHLEMFKRWVAGGGIGYFASEAHFGSLANKLDIAKTQCVNVVKESGASFGKEEKTGEIIGELFVKGVLEAIEIRDHPITLGIRSLYVGPVGCTKNLGGLYYFESKGTPITPILRLGYGFNAVNGSIGLFVNQRLSNTDSFIAVIYGVVEFGKGLIVLDGTGMILGANSFKGYTYDWPRLYDNLLGWASRR